MSGDPKKFDKTIFRLMLIWPQYEVAYQVTQIDKK